MAVNFTNVKSLLEIGNETLSLQCWQTCQLSRHYEQILHIYQTRTKLILTKSFGIMFIGTMWTSRKSI